MFQKLFLRTLLILLLQVSLGGMGAAFAQTQNFSTNTGRPSTQNRSCSFRSLNYNYNHSRSAGPIDWWPKQCGGSTVLPQSSLRKNVTLTTATGRNCSTRFTHTCEVNGRNFRSGPCVGPRPPASWPVEGGGQPTKTKRRPNFTVVKTVDANSYSRVGEPLRYTITVRNTGNVRLTHVAIDDALTDNERCPGATLAAGKRMICRASYTVKKADLDRGSITNTATIDTKQTGSKSDSVTVRAANFTVVKTANAATYSRVGEVLRYTITVTNTGKVRLTHVTIDDALTDNERCPGATLAAGKRMICRASYTVKKADLDAGSITNTATIDTKQTGPKRDSVTVRAAQAANFTVVKAANAATYNAVGDVLRYTITVRNTGNVTLTGVTIADPLTDDESCPQNTLAAGDTMTCTASYTVTQTDLDNGSITNTATIDTIETGPETGTTTVNADRLQQFTVVKATTADVL